jgi:hypothetical protein
MNNSCKYCHDTYQARPQVKNPQACNKSQCQKLRQANNEKLWRQKNQNLYDKKYHRIKKSVRDSQVKKIVAELIESFMTGLRFKGKMFSETHILYQFFNSLGIRFLNKFYTPISSG